MTSKVSIIKPRLCICAVSIDGVEFDADKDFHMELPYGKHTFNAGIWVDAESFGGIYTWARELVVDVNQPNTVIKIYRKWHLLTHATADFKVQ